MKKSEFEDFSLFFLNGDEEFSKQETMEKIRKYFFEIMTMKEFDYFNFDFNTVNPENFESALKQYPMGNIKLIILTQFNPLQKTSSALESDDDSDEKNSGNPVIDLILSFAEKPYPEIKLIIKTAKKISENLKIIKAVKKGKQFYESFVNPYSNQIAGEVSRITKSLNKNISSDAIDLMVILKGESIEDLGNAVKELVIFIGDKNKIEKEDVEALFISTRTEDSIKSVEYFLKGDLENFLDILRNKFELENEAPERFLGSFFYYLKRLIYIKSCLANNMSLDEIQEQTGIPKFFLKKDLIYTKRFKAENLMEMVKQLKELDLNAKFNRKYSLFLLEMFFVSNYLKFKSA
ncbi:MAG: DNA polymerase III subunit delta [bacterium]|nr:DNA polymerase III subunit delta [bacterium]